MSQRTKQQVKLQDSKTLTRHWDAFGRPVGYSVDGDRKQSITYDPATGRIAESDDIGNRTVAEGKTYTANNLNQYTAIDDFTPQYDADGNQTLIKTETGIWSVLYNAENRPIRWQSGDIVITMAFDRMGRRVEMRAAKDGEETLQRFVYDNYLCIQQLRGADNTLFQSYVWDPTEPIATRPLVFLPASGVLSYYFHDGNKNVSDLVDTQGSVVHYDYAPFGASTTSTLSINPFQFSSEYADDNLHLVYYNYRHYNAETGKWITREPFDEDEAFGLYNMLKNGVASKSDWLGLLFYYYKTINENYSSLPGGVRALTHVQETVATQCSSTYRLSIIITIAVEIRLLKPTHAAWKTRYRRYNMLWGNPRTNESERKAALTHEQDHVQVIETEMKALRSLNTLDGRQYTTMCECEEKEREIEAFVEKYDEKVKKLLKRQDKYPYNQGGINVYE